MWKLEYQGNKQNGVYYPNEGTVVTATFPAGSQPGTYQVTGGLNNDAFLATPVDVVVTDVAEAKPAAKKPRAPRVIKPKAPKAPKA